MKNALGIDLPEEIPGYGVVTPYSGVFTSLLKRENVGGLANPVPPAKARCFQASNLR